MAIMKQVTYFLILHLTQQFIVAQEIPCGLTFNDRVTKFGHHAAGMATDLATVRKKLPMYCLIWFIETSVKSALKIV